MLSPVRSGHLPVSQTICSRCRLRLSRANRPGPRWSSGAASGARDSPTQRSLRTALQQEYFSPNTQLPLRIRDTRIHRNTAFFRGSQPAQAATFASAAAPSQTSKILNSFPSTTHLTDSGPGGAQKLAQGQDAIHTSSSPEAVTSSGAAHEIPPDASARLSQRAGGLPPTSLRRRMATYLALSKPRLTFLMVLTTASAYALYPVPTILSSATTAAPSLSALTLVYLTSGTALCSASANALNMLLEPEHDAKMSRTRNRPLVRGLIGKRGALLFAVLTGSLGAAGLYFGVNPTVSFLGTFNILLYAGVYTPLKRVSVLNTWVGALVGAIPPLMGWAAAAGQHASGAGTWRELLLGEANAGGWLLATLLYAWQFPHFNALSWTIRAEYRAAGYRMMAWVNERRNARIALRYAFWFFPICAGLSYVGVTDRAFLVSSSLVNAWLVREAYRFWKFQGQRGSARALFWAGVWQLPALLVLAMFHKQGLWDGVWRWVKGEVDEDVDDEGYMLEQERRQRPTTSHPALQRVRVS